MCLLSADMKYERRLRRHQTDIKYDNHGSDGGAAAYADAGPFLKLTAAGGCYAAFKGQDQKRRYR